MDNIFDEIENTEKEFYPEIKKTKENKPIKEYFPIAYQIYRVLKKKNAQGIITHERIILDTIPVYRGEVELAKNIAIEKARNHGLCFVIELSERNVITITEESAKAEGKFRYIRARRRR